MLVKITGTIAILFLSSSEKVRSARFLRKLTINTGRYGIGDAEKSLGPIIQPSGVSPACGCEWAKCLDGREWHTPQRSGDKGKSSNDTESITGENDTTVCHPSHIDQKLRNNQATPRDTCSPRGSATLEEKKQKCRRRWTRTR
jgi:hypothetical protein